MRLTSDREHEEIWDIPLIIGMILFIAVWVFMLVDVRTSIVAREPTIVTVQASEGPPSRQPVSFPRPVAPTSGKADVR
jgi:hypothetical protein